MDGAKEGLEHKGNLAQKTGKNGNVELTPLEDWEEAKLRTSNELVAFHHIVIEALQPDCVLIHDVHFHRLDMVQKVDHKQDEKNVSVWNCSAVISALRNGAESSIESHTHNVYTPGTTNSRL